ncbi:T9SS type A sorting domain-containing protein [Persicobacter diffluens]|uniref:Secretion system C-terminal sorting domain-containing protein n=1 Tax=Persicobacter diffluens TaxID=981 RepID=A0AAN4W2C5_9BACT|nr:hypothetical protein PEDI_37770 [Persicobacter diffluens]
MNTNPLKYLAVFLLMTLNHLVLAQTTVWNPAANPDNTDATEASWAVVNNWTNGVPTSTGVAIFNVQDAISCTLDQVVTVNKFVLGDGGTGSTARLVIKNGGELTTGVDWSGTAWTDAYHTELVVEEGGLINFMGHFWNGWQGHSDVFITGGIVNVAGMLGTAFEEGTNGTSVIYIQSGNLNLQQFHPEKTIPDGSFWNLTGGTVSIQGDHKDNIENLAAQGRILTTGQSGEENRTLSVVLQGADAEVVTVITAEENVEAPVPAETVWNPAANPDNAGATAASWSVAANWTNGVPGEITVVKFTKAGAIDCEIDRSVKAKQVVLGDGEESGSARLIIKDGGFLSTSADAWSGAAWAAGFDTDLVVEQGGTIDFGQHFWNGWQGHSDVFITGGIVNVAGMLGTAFEEGTNGTSVIYIQSGNLNLQQFHPEKTIPDGSFWNLTGGTVSIQGDHKDNIENLAAQGRILTTGQSGEENRTLSVVLQGADAEVVTVITAEENVEAPVPAETVWNPAANPDNAGATAASWSVAANWTNGVPGEITVVKFTKAGAIDCEIDRSVKAKQVVLGDGEESGSARLIIKDGGFLSTSADAWSGAAWAAGFDTDLVVEQGGTIDFGQHFWNGWQGNSTVYLRGGRINVANMYGTAFEDNTTGTSTTYITSGEMNLNEFHAEKSLPDGSVWNITNGFVYIKGNHKSVIENLYQSGRILTTGEDGQADLSLKVEIIGLENDPITKISTTTAPTEPEIVETVWNPMANPDNEGATSASWSVAANWTEGVPTPKVIAKFNIPDAINCYIDQRVGAKQLILGDGGEEAQSAKLIVKNGGALQTSEEWSGLAWTANYAAELVVEEGGEINFGGHFWNGWDGHATVFIQGGIINVNQMYGTAFDESSAGTSITYVEAGELNLIDFHPEKSLPDGSVWNITAGSIYIKGDHRATLTSLQELGRIVTTGESGEEDRELLIEVSGEGEQALTRIHTKEKVGTPEPPLSTVEQRVILSPNPTSGMVLINVKNQQEGDNFVVYNSAGHMVMQGALTPMQTNVNLQDLPAGVYYVTVFTSGQRTSHKLMKR